MICCIITLVLSFCPWIKMNLSVIIMRTPWIPCQIEFRVLPRVIFYVFFPLYVCVCLHTISQACVGATRCRHALYESHSVYVVKGEGREPCCGARSSLCSAQDASGQNTTLSFSLYYSSHSSLFSLFACLPSVVFSLFILFISKGLLITLKNPKL